MKMGDMIEHQITRERQNTNDTIGLNKANNCAARAANIFLHFPDVFNKAKKKEANLKPPRQHEPTTVYLIFSMLS